MFHDGRKRLKSLSHSLCEQLNAAAVSELRIIAGFIVAAFQKVNYNIYTKSYISTFQTCVKAVVKVRLLVNELRQKEKKLHLFRY